MRDTVIQPRDQAANQCASLRRVWTLPGVRSVLSFVLAHHILSTYIAPLLAAAAMGSRIDWMLFASGLWPHAHQPQLHRLTSAGLM